MENLQTSSGKLGSRIVFRSSNTPGVPKILYICDTCNSEEDITDLIEVLMAFNDKNCPSHLYRAWKILRLGTTSYKGTEQEPEKEHIDIKWALTIIGPYLKPTRRRLKKLIEVLPYMEEMELNMCATCKLLNPQHRECTSCEDIEDYRHALSVLKSQVSIVKNDVGGENEKR